MSRNKYKKACFVLRKWVYLHHNNNTKTKQDENCYWKIQRNQRQKKLGKVLSGGFYKHTINNDGDWISYELKFEGGAGIVCSDKKDRNELCDYLRKEGRKQLAPTDLGFDN